MLIGMHHVERAGQTAGEVADRDASTFSPDRDTTQLIGCGSVARLQVATVDQSPTGVPSAPSTARCRWNREVTPDDR